MRVPARAKASAISFSANIRETDAICEVVRFFSDPNVEHVSKKVDPQSDVETIKTELVLGRHRHGRKGFAPFGEGIQA